VPVGPWEILIIAFFIVLLFGAKKLPEMGRALGTSMREFKEAIGFSSKDESEKPELEPHAESSEKAAGDRPAERSRAGASR
jgi:sec-independent protein translocase protein TatA